MSVSTKLRQRDRVGDSAIKVDGVPKVTGEFEYASDLHVTGMLYGCTTRSPHSHARIVGIDTSKAQAMGGVREILIYDDVPGQKTFGLEIPDQPVLAHDRVRYFGEPIAVVAAEDPETARLAARAVEVDYELLEPVTDPEAALDGDPLHAVLPPPADHWREDPRPNVVRSIVIRHGDPEESGDVSVSGVYEMGMQDQAFLGPEAGLAVPDPSGGVDIYTATQFLHQDLIQIAPCLGLDTGQVRVHLSGVGGAFGGREDISVQIHAALLALRTGRPVKFAYPRDESFVGHVHRHPAKIWAEHHANRDGTLVCVRVQTLLDGGAYASGSPAVTSHAALLACGPYRVPNALLESTSVYTNNPPCGAMRGFGVVQACYAAEAQMDKLARELGIDPVELRLINALAPGDVLPTGQRITGSLPVAETIQRCADLPVPEPEELPRDPLRLPGGAGNTTRGEGLRQGVGFAVAIKNICYSEGYDDYASARMRLFTDADGELVAEVYSAAVEFGQGLTNVIVQVVQTELDIDRVEPVQATTHDLDSAGSSAASRQAWMTAGAVRLCCDAIRHELAEWSDDLAPGDEIDVRRTYRHAPTSRLDPETGQATGDRAQVAFCCAAMRVVAEVDVELGLMRLVWIGTAQDVGMALNPMAVEGQIEGGTVQGLGLALMEEIKTQDGVISNASFTDYLIPTMLDVPPIEIALVEEPEPDAPYGIKGVGEAPAVVSTAAVASALRNATGLELPRVPARPEDIAVSEPAIKP